MEPTASKSEDMTDEDIERVARAIAEIVDEKRSGMDRQE